MNSFPVIRLEVEHMKHTMLTSLQEHAAQIDLDVQRAVEAYCTPENIGSVVRQEAMKQLDIAIKEEVRDFFSRSKNGRKAVREAVNAYLDERDLLGSKLDDEK